MRTRLKQAGGGAARVFRMLCMWYGLVGAWAWYAIMLMNGNFWAARFQALIGALCFAFYVMSDYYHGEMRYAEGELAQLQRIIESGACPPQQVRKQYWRW